MIHKKETFILIVVVKFFVDDDWSEDNDVVHQLSVFLDERDQRRWGSCLI